MKPTIMLLRGLAREHRHWCAFPDILQQHLPMHKVLAPDTQGNGIRYRERSPLSVAAMVEDLRQQREGSEPLFLIAISLGGMIAAEWAYRYPDELQGMLLINTSFRSLSPMHHRLKTRWYLPFAKALTNRNEIERERFILSMTSHQRKADEQLIKQWAEYAQQYPIRPSNVLRQLIAAARFKRGQQAPAVNSWVVLGEQDQMVDPRCSVRIAQQWNRPLLTSASSGHDLTIDDPHWLAEQVVRCVKLTG